LSSRPIVQQFTEFPTRIDLRLYAEAARLYATKVSGRAIAVYQVGSTNYPGLSDIDLLVVVRTPKLDNEQFFSVYRRLPQRTQLLFLHEPFIVPLDCVDVLRFTSHTRKHLLSGQDVAAAILHDNSTANAWCLLFEGLWTYQSYFALVSRTATIRVRFMTAVASALRFTLAQFDRIQRTDFAATYGAQIDVLREALMANPLSQTITLQIFDTFFDALQSLKRALRERLPLLAHEEPLEFGKRFLMGERKFDEVDSSWLYERAQSIARYHLALTQLKMSYGYLFFTAAYGDSIKRYQQHIVSAKWLNAYYRTDRVLDDVLLKLRS